MIDVKDILLNDDFDLLIKKGDFVVDYSDNQHQKHLILAYKGYYKEAPLVGVGISDYINSAGKQAEIKREIQIELEADNYLVDSIDVRDVRDYKVSVKAKRIK